MAIIHKILISLSSKEVIAQISGIFCNFILLLFDSMKNNEALKEDAQRHEKLI